MQAGPHLIFLWATIVIASFAIASVLLVIRQGKRAQWAAIALLGTLMTFGFISAWIGMLEKAWTIRSGNLWASINCGIFGALLALWGWREILKPLPGPGECEKCGYKLAGLTKCPECGKSA